MATPMTKITFFERFEADILSGKKTITLRDEAESGFQVGQVLPVSTFEADRWFCEVEITAVSPIRFEALTELEAEQENMTLPQLKAVIQEIYPGIEQLYKIEYKLKK